jgi:LuxR family maltose regulon positive regulatory protein
MTNLEPILRTKLHRPSVPEGFVCREQLHGLLDRGLQTAFTLVSAPAGYGKSTLVSHWGKSLEVPCAWLSMGENDGDLDVFVSYLLAAVKRCFPDACPETEALITAPGRPPISVLGRSLINELDDIGTPFVLVLDDYHKISPRSEVHNLLAFFLEHPPRLPCLAIVTRHDPPLPLASLRGAGRITEIRTNDLRFGVSEIDQFLDGTSGLKVGREALENLQEQTEGWAAALRLVSLHIRHLEEPEKFLTLLSGGVQHLQDYLLQEIWARRSPQMQDWLLTTSILDGFCVELCDAVCAPDGAGEASDLDGLQFVDALRRMNLFTIALDNSGAWSRYHHLFQSWLQDQLELRKEPEQIAALHSRASSWLLDADMPGEAVNHALAAGDVSTAAQIIESRRGAAFNEDRWRLVNDWLTRLPDEIIKQSAGLLLTRAWTIYAQNQFALIPGILEQLERCPDELDEGEAGEIAFFEAILHFFSGEAKRCVERSEDALRSIPTRNTRFRSEAEIFRGLGLQMGGQADEAIRFLADSGGTGAYGGPVGQARLIACEIYIHLLSARLPEAHASCERLSRISGVNLFVSCWDWTLRGLTLWWANDIEKAAQPFSSVVDHRHFFGSRAAVDAMVGLALSYSSLHKDAEAADVMNRTIEFAAETEDPTDLMIARSGEARLAVLQGDLSSAKAWLRTAVHPAPDVSMLFWLEVPSVTRCRVLLADGSQSNLEQALDLIEEHLKAADITNNTCRSIEALVLKTTALEKLGRGEEALVVLESAVALAEPGNFLRPFVENGQSVAALLDRLAEKDGGPAIVEDILSVIHQTGEVPIDGAEPRQQVSSLLENLTNREHEVLELLAKRLQNKEIAAELFISTQTVNSHLKSIYQKLDVKNRRQAAAKAVEMGLLRHD